MTTPLSFRLLHLYSRLAPTERGGFRLARLARRVVPRDRWTGTFAVDGLSFDLDLSTYPDIAMAGGVYELDTLRLLRRLLRPGMSFVDGGANLGYFTCHAAQFVGPRGRVEAVEPDPTNRARLEANLDHNLLSDRVRVNSVALSNEAGDATFYRPLAGKNRNHGESGRYLPQGVPSEPFPVKLRRLDELFPDPPDVIKLDLEGSELLAVEGAAGWFGRGRAPTWIVEHNPGAATRASRKAGDVWRVLRDGHAGYSCKFIAHRPWAFDAPEQLDSFARQGNLLFTP